MRKWVCFFVLLFVAFAIGLTPLHVIGADSGARQIARDTSSAKPYSYTKTFTGNTLVYEVNFKCHNSNTDPLTITYDCAAGSAYDVVISSTTMGSGANIGKARISFDPEFYVQTGDKLIVQQANENSAACSTAIHYSPWKW